MDRLKSFIGLSLFGGLAVILPVTVFFLVGRWLLTTLSNLIAPISDPIAAVLGQSPIVADLLVIILFLSSCLVAGIVVRTAMGSWLHRRFDTWLVQMAPGYKTIRAMTTQLLGGAEASGPLSGEVVVARVFGPDVPTLMTGIVTSSHANGWFTVYVPTAPVPTSGLTYHLPPDSVDFLPGVTVEEAMRSVIACGAGSAELLIKQEANRVKTLSQAQ